MGRSSRGWCSVWQVKAAAYSFAYICHLPSAIHSIQIPTDEVYLYKYRTLSTNFQFQVLACFLFMHFSISVTFKKKIKPKKQKSETGQLIARRFFLGRPHYNNNDLAKLEPEMVKAQRHASLLCLGVIFTSRPTPMPQVKVGESLNPQIMIHDLPFDT